MLSMSLATLTAFAMLLGSADAVRILFVGNSFTYVNDLPGMLQQIAHSLGKTVVHNSSTIGGCTLYYQFPDPATTELLKEEWDYIVLQDFSEMGTVQQAREVYMKPAIESFAEQKKSAKIVLYNTWGYFAGSSSDCPSSDTSKCFPLGTLASLTEPDCSKDKSWHDSVGDFDCMSYSISRAYLDVLHGKHGADLLVPCGEAWQVARMSKSIQAACQTQIDKEYSTPVPVALPLPLVPDAGDTSHIMLYRDEGADKHPSPAGQYLNALSFYSMIFQESPEGAINLSNLTQADALSLQKIAADVVLSHVPIWTA